MSDFKEKIKNCFNNSSSTYDEYSKLQKNIAVHLLEILTESHNSYEEITDIACGSGVSTQLLIGNIIYKKIYAVDFSDKLLSMAQKKLNALNVEYKLMDFDEKLFLDSSMDLIFSNMGLQWSENLFKSLKSFNVYLNNDGCLAFSVPLDGTFLELNQSHRNHFYEKKQIEHFLISAGFYIKKSEVVTYVESFSGKLEALRSIKAVGATFLKSRDKKPSGLLTKKYFHQIFSDKFQDQLTYQIGFFIAKKDG